jgi:hypothetical protein
MTLPPAAPSSAQRVAPVRELRIPAEQLTLTLEPAREPPLETPFVLKSGKLWIGIRYRDGDPHVRPDPVGLFLVEGDSALYVNDLNRLRGHVRVSSPDEALAFVRLLTSPRTWRAMVRARGGGAVEVISEAHVSGGFFFGDPRPLLPSRVGPLASGLVGILSPRDAQRMKLLPASVRTTTGGYEIRRTLYRDEMTPGTERLLDVVEEVTPDGGFARRALRIRRPPRGFYFALPREE